MLNNNFVEGGGVYVSSKDEMVWTVLGSCVSIIFYHPPSKTGGICHAQLPEPRNREEKCSDTCANPCYRLNPKNELVYVSCAFRYLLKEFARRNIKSRELSVILVGGASIFETLSDKRFAVGRQNVDLALKLIRRHKLNLREEDTGGAVSRTVKFFPREGRVEIKRLPVGAGKQIFESPEG